MAGSLSGLLQGLNGAPPLKVPFSREFWGAKTASLASPQ